MILCWDNLEKISKVTRNGNFMINKSVYYYHESCIRCGNSYLGLNKRDSWCSRSCSKLDKKRQKNSKIRKDVNMKRPEHSKRMSGNNHPLYGKHHSEETRQKISISMSGKNHPCWKGGISCEPYCWEWKDREYKNWIKYKRDSGKCQNPQCNGKSTRIVLHHINYIKKDCKPTNLIALCVSCNSKANKDREWHTAWYLEIVKRRNK